MTKQDKLVLDSLDAIEEKESELLAWGDTEVSLTYDEVRAVVQSQAHRETSLFFSVDDVIQKMVDQCLLLECNNVEGTQLYRTRMAETIRLHTLSRQWFHGQSLDQSKTLVSDYRFVRRPRRYPTRSHESASLVESWKDDLALNNEECQIMQTLLTDGDIQFKLSGFQVRSTERIVAKYREHKKPQSSASATIVCSGTGSGKTLSFYLPAITQLAHDLLSDSAHRVRILAIYPRNELLKDQFAETYAQVRKLDEFLLSRGSRKIRIGTYFGDTFYERFTKDNQTFTPLTCPASGCSGEMVWKKPSKAGALEQIVCRVCGHAIGNDELGLTREGQEKSPPDILFTSTEMLNQRLGDSKYNKLFGVGGDQPIPMVLMDEVHTYEGLNGAQVGYLLKRWMKRANIRPHFVGLSATLDDAAGFFSDLTGTSEHQVELVEPFDSEMEDEGAEYLLALRGDPVSQSALLSTTIQATMLTTRMLDALGGPKPAVSNGLFGQKTFVFTDDLDVINRLYEQVLDAEGWDRSYQELRPKTDPSLAYLRSPLNPDYQNSLTRLYLGQDWGGSARIGHDMSRDHRITISRTSSQDSGVSQDAQVVVATASLEVGFNDPAVGAVIQHKAPRGMASYLQRKGRAGRKRGMRPWMYTVLSDFGRDRVAFQQYEQLINPCVKAFKLPVQNSHIQKMQAAMACLDWLNQSTQSHKGIWQTLGSPQKADKHVLSSLKIKVGRLLSDDNELEKLGQYIKSALRVTEEELQVILWQSPRSIAMEFLPSLLHKLDTNWSQNGHEWLGADGKSHPLPEFIPGNLFSELITPSLYVRLERGAREAPSDNWESMGFFQGIKEFAPGRISKRFSIAHRSETDWLVPEGYEPEPGTVLTVPFDIEDAFDAKETQEYVTRLRLDDGQVLDVYNPVRVKTRLFDKARTVSETSNAFLTWHSVFQTPYDRSSMLAPPSNSDWTDALEGIKFYTHEEMNPIELIRYSSGSDAQIKFRRTREAANVRFDWSLGEKTVGIGTRLWVDGMKLVFKFAPEQRLAMAKYEDNPQLLKFAYLEDAFLAAPCYRHEPFFAKWVFDCVMSAIFIAMNDRNLSMEEALNFLSTGEGVDMLMNMPRGVFQMREMSADANDGLREQALQLQLLEYFEQPLKIAEMIEALSAIEYTDQDEAYLAWLKKVLGYTVSGGVSRLVNILLPDVSDTEVNVDHAWSGDELTVWVTEAENGGVGTVTRLRDTYLSDPLNVLTHLSRTFEADEYEQVDVDLSYLLKLLPTHPDLSSALDKLRTAVGYEQRLAALHGLHHALAEVGIVSTHVWNNMLHTRVLRPGSNEQDDAFLYQLLTDWSGLEEKFGLEIPLHIAAHLLARQYPNPRGQLSEFANTITGLLWPRGNQIRQSGLAFYNRFDSQGNRSERCLLDLVVSTKLVTVAYESEWERQLEALLVEEGRCVLRFDLAERAKVGSAFAVINTMEVDMKGLIFHPRVSRLKRELGALLVYVEIAEVIQ